MFYSDENLFGEYKNLAALPIRFTYVEKGNQRGNTLTTSIDGLLAHYLQTPRQHFILSVYIINKYLE